jgi:uncharacterized RmlC-like cupin family protein
MHTFPVMEELTEDEGWIRMLVQFVISKENGGASKLAFGRTVLPPGARHDVHRHFGVDEAVYVQSGRGVIRNGDDQLPVSEGDVLFSPQGVWHGIWNNSDEETVLIWAWGGASSIEAAGYEVARPSPWVGIEDEGE